MATDVTLPALGESVTEGTVTQWLKSVGDDVAVDEPLLEVSTDKVDTEIPSPVAGKLLEIKAAEDETVEVGAVLAVIGDEGGSDAGEAADEQPAQDSDGAQQPSDEGQSEGQPEGASDDGQPSDEGQSEQQPEDDDQVQLTNDQVNQPTQAQDGDPQTDEGANDEPPSQQQPAAQAGAKPSQAGSGSDSSTDITLPALGESVTEGTLTQWLKSVGDEVAVDEALLEVSTDKVDTEIPSPVAGTLLEIKVSEDETVEVGAVLAVIGSSDSSGSVARSDDDKGSQPAGDGADSEAPPEPDLPDAEPQQPAEDTREQEQEQGQKHPTQEQEQAAPAPSRAPSPAPSQAPSSSDSEQEKSYVTPLVRKLASQHGVQLSQLTGTGVGGRIRKQDVLQAAETAKQAASEPDKVGEESTVTAEPPAAAAAASALRGKTEKLSRLRKVIATRMVESLQVSAQLTTVVEVDVTAISRLRDKTKTEFEQREGVKLSFLPFFAKAAIDALKTYPQVNASIDTEAGTVTYHDGEHLGVAVDTERGLLVPVIKDAGDLSIAGLARKIADLAARTRNNKISPDELSGGTFTLTNTGSRGALFDTPIINQPQVAILGTGTVVKRAVVIDDPNLGETIAIRKMVYLALTYDHRLVDGADAARFLTAVKERLEEARFESEIGL